MLNLSRLQSEVGGATGTIQDELETAMKAIRTLLEERPLASEFPNGSPRPELLSPKQVVCLAHLAEPHRL